MLYERSSPLRLSVLKGSTKLPPSRPNGGNKRKRDDEEEPERKRTKIDARPMDSNALADTLALQSEGSQANHESSPLIEKWLSQQKGDYEPMETASLGIGSEAPEPVNQRIPKQQASRTSNKSRTSK